MLTAALLQELVETHRREGADATILSAEPPDPASTAASFAAATARVLKVVEGTDASEDVQRIREINSSIYVFRSAALWPALERLEPKNVQGELYLTDAIEHVVGAGGRVVAHVAADYRETDGVNTRVELAHAAAVLRDRINEQHMLAGVTIVDPQTTWIEPTVELEPDSTIHPFTVLRGATRVATGAEVGSNTVAIDAHIGAGAIVGPFCYLRPGTVLGESSKAGTFVEIKNSRIGDRTKVPHLSYIGDADIGDDTNVGAGAITANFAASAGCAEGPHDDRQQRQDRYPQWLRRTHRDRGWGLDRCWFGHYERRPRRRARVRAAEAGEQGGICSPWARVLSSSFPVSNRPS